MHLDQLVTEKLLKIGLRVSALFLGHDFIRFNPNPNACTGQSGSGTSGL
jgi:hypothetical protein